MPKKPKHSPINSKIAIPAKPAFVLPQWAKVSLVALCAILPYISTLHYPFSYMDDNLLVLMQEDLLADADVVRAFQSEFFNQADELDYFYRPLQTLTFIMDYQLAGTQMYQYRLTGILIHALVAITLLYFLTLLGVSARVSFLLSLIFAVHPAMAPVQLFIAARGDSLAALCILLSMISLIHYAKSPKPLWLVLHLVAFACALFSKEMGVFVPVLGTVFLLTYTPLAGKRLRLWLRCVAFWVVWLAVWFFLRRAALVNPPQIDLSIVLLQFLENLPGTFIYIGVLLAPISLPSLLLIKSLYWVVGTLATAAVAVLLLRQKPRRVPLYILLLALAWYTCFVLVTFLSPSNLPLFDFLLNRTYIPAIGVLLLAGYLLDSSRISARTLTTVTLLCLPVLMFFNVQYTRKHPDRITTWNTFAQQAPDSYHVLKHQLLAYEDARRQTEVPHLYLKAAKLSPNTPNVNYSAGAVLYKQGQKEAAYPYFRKEQKINPQHAENLNYMGVYHEEKQQVPQAKEYYLQSVAADSSCKSCLWNSARACAMTADRVRGRTYLARMKRLGYPVPIPAVEEYLMARP